MPTDSYIILPTDASNSGKKARTITDTVSGEVVHTSVTTPASTSAAPVVTDVVSSATNVTVIPANADRRGACVYNDCDKALYLKLGTTASTTSFTIKVAADGYYELPHPCYTGQVDGIWAASPTGSARVTELL